MTPTGALNTIGKDIAKIAKYDDVVALDAYIASDAFIRALALVKPVYRPTIFIGYLSARAACLKRRPIAAPGTHKAKWDAAQIERLAVLARKYNCMWPRVAHDLGITEGSAKRAYVRYCAGASATEKAARKPQDGQIASGMHPGALQNNGRARLDMGLS